MRHRTAKIVILQSVFLLLINMTAIAQETSIADIESFFKKEASDVLGARDALDYLKEKSETESLYCILINTQNQALLMNRKYDLAELVSPSEKNSILLSRLEADSTSRVEMIFVCEGNIEVRDSMLQVLYVISQKLQQEGEHRLIVFEMAMDDYRTLNEAPAPPIEEGEMEEENGERELEYTEEELVAIGERHNAMHPSDESVQEVSADDQSRQENGFWHSPFGMVILAIVGIIAIVGAYYIFKIVLFAFLTGVLFAVVGGVITLVICVSFSFSMNVTSTASFVVGAICGVAGIIFSAFNVKGIVKSRLASELPNLVMDDFKRNQKLDSQESSLQRDADLASRDFNNEVSKVGSGHENEYSLSRSAREKDEAERRLSDFEADRRNGRV